MVFKFLAKLLPGKKKILCLAEHETYFFPLKSGKQANKREKSSIEFSTNQKAINSIYISAMKKSMNNERDRQNYI
jgi:hypothetical protein